MKYKKLDNLDDLRVGDVLTMKNERLAKEIVKIEGELIFAIYLGEYSYNPMTTNSLAELKFFNYTAKRPLPGGVKKQIKYLNDGSVGYMPNLFDPSSPAKLAYYHPVNKAIVQRGLWFKTPKLAKEAALKMIKAINN